MQSVNATMVLLYSCRNEHLPFVFAFLCWISILQVGLRSQVWPFTTSRDNNFLSFRQPDVHHSEERYLELLDSINGVTETYHLTSLTFSPGVTEPYHLTLLDSFRWRYWAISPDVTGQFHLALLNRVT